MRLYIAGPISGVPDHNEPAFSRAEQRLSDNPITHVGVGGTTPWAEYVKFDLHVMLDCDGIAVLPDWEESRGASLEVYVAQQLAMPVLTVDEWIRGPEEGPQ
jgi:hypothetical protein